MNNRRVSVLFLVLAIIGSAFVGMAFLSSLKEPPKKMSNNVPTRFVKAEKVKYSDILTHVAGKGRIVSQQEVDLIAEVQGQILPGDVPFKKGQSFQSGMTLVKIFDQEARFTLMAQKSRFLNALANLLADFKVDFPDSYPQWQKFFDSIDVNHELPKMPDPASKQEKIFLASRNILSDYFSIKSSEIRLQKYAIQAPFDGTFTDVLLEVSSIANPGSRLAKIMRTDKLELEVPLFVNDLEKLKIGDPVEITLNAERQKWSGKIVRKANFIEPSTQQISVFVSLKSHNEQPFYRGQYPKVMFHDILIKNGMELPRNAVFNYNEVFIVEDGRLAKKEINLLKVNDKTVIFSGLDEGVDIVVEPLFNANENALVEIMR